MTFEAGCTVTERVTLRRERVLPVCGEVLVRRGDAVEPETIIAKAETVPGHPYVIDVAALVGSRFSPDDFSRLLRVRIGDQVAAGDILAEFRTWRLSEPRFVRSPVTGVIEFIARSAGRLLVRENPRLARPFVIVNVAGELDVPPRLLRAVLRVQAGDEVRQGMVLAAVADPFRGVRCSFAPASGIISDVCVVTGRVTIIRPSRPATVTAYLRGRVERVVPDLGAVISGEVARLEGVFGIGFEASGPLRRLVSDPAAELHAHDIDENCRGRVLVGGGYVGLAALQRALAVGVSGIVCGAVDQLDLVGLLGHEISAGLTGQEDIALTLVVTEGFGRRPMAEPAFALLAGHEGAEASLNGTTQVRAGAIRPEVIVSLPAAR